MATTIAKKVTKDNHLPGVDDARFPVYSKQFNELVDVVKQIEPTDGDLTPSSVLCSGGDSAGLGYATGAGGSAIQGSGLGRATGITINAYSGSILTDNASLAFSEEVTFTVTNSKISIHDNIIVTTRTMTTGTPFAFVSDVSAGSFDITVTNLHASTPDTSNDVINFSVIEGVSE